MRAIVVSLALAIGILPSVGTADPLLLGYGRVVEGPVRPPVGESGDAPMALATLVEHVEFLLAHEYRISGLSDLSSSPGETAVILFDDVESFRELVLPLVEVWEIPVVVTVPVDSTGDEGLEAALEVIAGSPWVELAPRVDRFLLRATGGSVDCDFDDPLGVEKEEEEALSALAGRLHENLEWLRGLGVEPSRAVVWPTGFLYGPASAVARAAGLPLQVTTHRRAEGLLPDVDGALPRLLVEPTDGVWALVQASVAWDPGAHPVRFLGVDGAWICRGEAREKVRWIEAMIRGYGLNGVRLDPVADGTAWFPTRVLPVGGSVVGPLVSSLRESDSVAWILVDVPSVGDEARDLALAVDLVKAVAPDVAILPRVAWAGRVRDAIRFVRPGTRIAWRHEEASTDFDFEWAPRSPAGFGRTVAGGSAEVLDRNLLDASARGIPWLGVEASVLEAIVSRGDDPKELHLPRAPDPPEQAPDGGLPQPSRERDEGQR